MNKQLQGVLMEKKYLTTKDASELLTLAPSTIYTYVHYRKIPFIKIGGRIAFEENTLNQWMQSKRRGEIKRK